MLCLSQSQSVSDARQGSERLQVHSLLVHLLEGWKSLRPPIFNVETVMTPEMYKARKIILDSLTDEQLEEFHARLLIKHYEEQQRELRNNQSSRSRRKSLRRHS